MGTASNEEIIYGKNAVTEALKAEKPIDTVFVLKSAQGMNQIIALAKKQGIVVKDAGEDKLKANIGIYAYRHGESSYHALFDAGVCWYDARFQTEVYLEEGNSFDIVLTPLNGKDARYGKVTLTGLPERKTPTRLYIEISMTGENKVRLYVEDLGFGELSPSGYQKWTEKFEI